MSERELNDAYGKIADLKADLRWAVAHIEALESIRAAAQELSDDIHECYPEGLASLDGLRPLIERLDAALAAGEERP